MSKYEGCFAWDETGFDKLVESIFSTMISTRTIPVFTVDPYDRKATHATCMLPFAYAFFKYLLRDAPLGPGFSDYCDFLHEALENEISMHEASVKIRAAMNEALDAMREGPKS